MGSLRYNKIVSKFGLENEDKMLAEQLELCPQRNSTAAPTIRPKMTVFNLDESKEYLKRTPILKFSRV